MGKRKDLKKKARLSIRQSYWRAVSVCFLIAMMTTTYPATTTFFGFHAVSGGILGEPSGLSDLSNSDVIMQIAGQFDSVENVLQAVPRPVIEAGGLVVDICTSASSFLFSVLRAVNAFISEEPGPAAVFLVVGVILSLLAKIFISNILKIGEHRFFMETRKYGQTQIAKIFFLYKLRCIWHPAWVMLCRSVCQTLWNLTIAGGIIKHYEYSMIPFILAENPKIGRKKAFMLSKQMMRNNKWKLFLLDLSFLGWRLVSLLTLGILDFLLVNPYMAGCKTEFYFSLRRNYVLSRCSGYEYLNDPYLEHVPSEDELLISKALYDDSQGPYTKISYFAPEQYPVFLFSVQPPARAVRDPVKAQRKYDWISYIFLFFVFSILGWILEILASLLRNGVLPEQMILSGPWLPLYGICGVILLLFIKRFSRKPVLVFALNFAIYSVASYLSSWLFEIGLGLQVRDYDNYFLNLNGRIYLGGSTAFALLGCAFLYYIAPRLTDWFLKRSRGERVLTCLALTCLGIADVVFTILTKI